jgi:hypothetical protein
MTGQDIVTYMLGNATVIHGCWFDTSFYLTFHFAALQLFTVQIYNTETSDFWFLTVAVAVTVSVTGFSELFQILSQPTP